MARAVDIPLPAVFEPLLKPARYKGIHGGRGGAKSHFFADQLIDDCLTHRGLRAVCIRETQLNLEQSCKQLLEDKIKTYGLEHEFRVLNTHIETLGDGIIIFKGMQSYSTGTGSAEGIKSLEGYDRAWIEEAQNLSQRSLDLLRPTIREPGSEIWASWNPRFPTDPVDKLLRGDKPPDAIVIHSSWRDNPWFPNVLRREMEWDRSRDIEKYEHVWGGGYEKHSESRVFKNWRIEDIEPPENTVFYVGGDWGFSVDPSVLIRVWLRDEHTLVIDAEAYQVGCEIDDTPALFDRLVCGCDPPRVCQHPERHGWAREWTIRADSARPETISYLQRHGYPKIEAATKGPNSVKEGVIFLQGYDIIVHSRCVHAIDELTHYSYVVDKLTNEVTPILEDKKNHVIDSVRYAVEKLRAPVYDNWVVA